MWHPIHLINSQYPTPLVKRQSEPSYHLHTLAGRRMQCRNNTHHCMGSKTRQYWLCCYTFFLYAHFSCKSLTHFRKLWISLDHLLLFWMGVIKKYWWCLVALTSSPSSRGMYVVKHKNVWEIMKATHYLATAQARVSTCSQCTDFGFFCLCLWHSYF